MMKLISCLFMSLLLLAGIAAATETHVVTLHKKAVVSAERVHLRDIAGVTGPDCERLAGIYLLQSPRGPIGSRLSSDYVFRKIRDEFKGSFELKGAQEVNITRKYVKISVERLERLFTETVLAESPWKDKGTIVIEGISISNSVTVLSQHRDIIQAKISPHEDFLGHTSIAFVFGEGSQKSQVNISARLKVIADVPVAKKPISRGDIITEADIEVRSLDISTYPRVVFDAQECIGKRAKTRLRSGRPFAELNMELPPLISRGDIVYIEVRSKNLVIRDKGEALKDGSLSEQIPVRNMTSGRQIVGTIIAASCVAVYF
ncbi:MAG TPA: flagellar basal body P-ring formation protein FlgA [Deltaproteobacteria bacterium]|nr:flagellar basal body P-ring formation protein FlgA [Deltaproteobacteria bacterium]